jgi:hypothetical protein
MNVIVNGVSVGIDWDQRRVCLHELPRTRIRFELRLPNNITVKGDDHMAVTLTSTQEFDIQIIPQDAHNNPAPVENVVWECSNAHVARLVAIDDLNQTVQAVGPAGTAQITVHCDAQIGEGVIELVGTLDVEVLPGQAVTLVVSSGPVREQTPQP